MSEISFGRFSNPSLTSMQSERLLGQSGSVSPQVESPKAGEKSFSETLVDMIQSVNEIQKDADKASQDFSAGKGSLHGAMIAMEKADISLRAINAVRGKLVEAYQEVMRMQI